MSEVFVASSQFNLPWLNLEGINPRKYEPTSFHNSNIVQHSPHPSRVRHIKDFEGAPICVVDSEDNFSKRKLSLHFPPNQYAENKLKMASKNFNLPWRKETENMVSAKPTLDTILAMKFFTGLRSMSFKNQPPFSISPRTNTSGWEVKLHDLTSEALAPIINKINKTEESNLLLRPSTDSTMKRMYSSSGRLLTARSYSRPVTCYSKRPSTTAHSVRRSEDFQVTSELDTQVFFILGGILQIQDPEVIKTWLLSSTDREKNLVVDILRSALLDKEELNMFVAEASKERPSQIIYTPNKGYSSTLSTIPEHLPSKCCDVLVINDENNNQGCKSLPRPPTSSTFRYNKPTTPTVKSSDEWVPNESIVIK